MITSEVTERQLAEWREIYSQSKSNIAANRIGGKQLDEYFRTKYSYSDFDNQEFRQVVYQNARQESPESSISDISTYIINGSIFVGIDLRSGFFHVESKDVKEAIPIWDDLFVKRGLSESDLTNYVLVVQYVKLTEKHSAENT